MNFWNEDHRNQNSVRNILVPPVLMIWGEGWYQMTCMLNQFIVALGWSTHVFNFFPKLLSGPCWYLLKKSLQYHVLLSFGYEQQIGLGKQRQHFFGDSFFSASSSDCWFIGFIEADLDLSTLYFDKMKNLEHLFRQLWKKMGRESSDKFL